MMTSLRTIGTLACILAVAATGCGGSTTVTGATGNTSFSATVTGAAAGSYSGYAGATVAGGIQAISMGTTDTKFALAFTRTGSKFVTGTFTLGDNLLTQYVGALNINNGTLYGSTGGTLTITSVTSTEIRGSFDFQGKLNNGSTTNALKGDFVATCSVGC